MDDNEYCFEHEGIDIGEWSDDSEQKQEMGKWRNRGGANRDEERNS